VLLFTFERQQKSRRLRCGRGKRLDPNARWNNFAYKYIPACDLSIQSILGKYACAPFYIISFFLAQVQLATHSQMLMLFFTERRPPLQMGKG
jgi:hypothetical protein